MDKKMMAGGALAGLLLVGGVVGSVSAQTAATQTGLSMEEVIAIALEKVPGEVQEIELEREDGVAIYEVEILTGDGKEVEMEIAAQTGEILQSETDDDKDDDDDDKDDS